MAVLDGEDRHAEPVGGLLLADRGLDVGEVTYGDGGVAAAVRIATARRSR